MTQNQARPAQRRANLKCALQSVLGVAAAGVGVGVLKFAAFGVDPFQVLIAGLDRLIPLGFGTVFLLTCLVLLAMAFAANRRLIGVGTFATLLFQGYVIDAVRAGLTALFPEAPLPLRAAAFIIGLVTLCFASAAYYAADMGVSPYDSVALILTHTLRVGTFQRNRILADCCCIVLGAGILLLCGVRGRALTASVGVGTIVTALCMGPLVEYFRTLLCARCGQKNAQN